MGGRGAGSGSSGGNKPLGKIYDYDNTIDSNKDLAPDGEDWWNSLTQKNKEFYKDYTMSGYEEFNDIARDAEGDTSKMKSHVKRYNAAVETLGRGKLDRNMLFHRKTTLSFLGLPKNASDAQMKAMVGQIVIDHGITSVRASKYPPHSNAFGKSNYHITTPAGTGIGAYVANHSSCGKGEDEFLFRPGSIYRVDRFYKDANGRPHFDMTYMGNTHDKKKK